MAQTELECWLEIVGLGQRVADQRCANPDRLQAKDVPVGITDIRLRFDVDSDATDEQLATLLKLTERYCVILQTLRTPPRLSATLQRSSA